MSRRVRDLKVTQPCPLKWASLSGEGVRRYCAQCDRHVHDLSALSRRQIRKLMASSTGRVCGMIRRDSRGRMITAPPWWKRIGTRIAAMLVMIQPGSCEPETPAEPVETAAPEPPELSEEEIEALMMLGYVE